MAEIIYKEERYLIIGPVLRCIKRRDVVLGSGLPRMSGIRVAVGSDSLCNRAQLANLYKGKPLKQVYVPDFISYEKIILEIKAVRRFVDKLRAQVHNYLKATGLKLGLLVHFGH
jgi:hypothetical protein